MNSRQYLEQAITLNNSIMSRLEELMYYTGLAETTGAIRYDRDGSQTQRSQSAPFENPVVHKADLERELNKEIDELWSQIREIRHTISKVPDTDVQNVLRLRFLCNTPVEVVASKLLISKSTVLRRLEDGYEAVAEITGYPSPPKQRMPARERHKIARDMMKEVYGNEQIH